MKNQEASSQSNRLKNKISRTEELLEREYKSYELLSAVGPFCRKPNEPSRE